MEEGDGRMSDERQLLDKWLKRQGLKLEDLDISVSGALTSFVQYLELHNHKKDEE